MRMKVFKFDNCDFVCAENLEQAIEFYTKETHLNESEIEVHEESLDEIMFVHTSELPEEEKGLEEPDALHFGKDTFVPRPFSWVIEGITQPCIIGSEEV